MQRVTMDFETRSAVDLRKTGAWIYSLGPSTEPLCLAYTLGEEDEPKIWMPEWVSNIIGPDIEFYGQNIGQKCPKDLAEAIESGAEIEAHNAFFERAIWNNIMIPRFGWPEIAREQWRCSAAKAAAASLPRSLNGATSALGVAKKDMGGRAVMLRVSKPRKALKAERKIFKTQNLIERKDNGWETPEGTIDYLWRKTQDDYQKTLEYCCQDVRAERALSQALPDLNKTEQRVWLVDQDINLRGLHVDVDMAKAAIKISNEVTEEATRVACGISDGAFTTLGQRDKIIAWLNSENIRVSDLQAATVKDLLDGELPDHVRTVLKCKKICSKSSVKKYEKILDTVDPSDDRVREVYMYHGASTGRWTGKHLQTQNLPRGKMKDPDTMCSLVKEGDPDVLRMFYSAAPTSILSWAIRGSICAPPGYDLVCADYSGVEARGLLWFVEDYDALEIFNRAEGEPGIYREMGGSIYNVDPASIAKEGDDRRQIGKQAILGLGYGMGAAKFRITCANYGQDVSEDFSKHVVTTYRDKFCNVPRGWRVAENAAIKAVQNPGTMQKAFRVQYSKRGSFLYCRLPSGRKLSYYSPQLKDDFTPWGEPTKKLTYMSVEQGKFLRTETYGGKLIENIVQALCRDLEAAAIVRVELGDNPYNVVMHTHDELVAEVPVGQGSVKEFEGLISRRPKWAEGFPLTAEGWRGKRYRK